MLHQLGIKSKLSVIFALMCLVVSLALAGEVYRISRQQVIEQYHGLARSAALTAASLINGDQIDAYLADGPTAEYLADEQRLEALKAAFGLRYLYVVRPITDNRLIYIFDIYTEGNDQGLIATLGQESQEAAVYDAINAAITDGTVSENPIITDTEYGWLASAYVPVYGSDGEITAVVGADVLMNEVFADIRMRTWQLAGLAAATILGCLAVLLLMTDRRVLNPIVRLSRHMADFSSADGVLRDFDVVESGDELQAIGESYNGLLQNMRTYATNLAEATAERERIVTELGIAAQIQVAMLPPVAEFTGPPNASAECALAATMVPARDVGGDFYDFFCVDDHTLAVVIADVSGKGVPAALFMVIAKTLIKVTAQSGKSPGEVLSAVNNLLCENNDAGMFVTAFLAYVDLSALTLTFANAGHNPPLIRSTGQACRLLETKPGFVLAGLPDMVYPDAMIPMSFDDSLLLYTDGVTEATNESLTLYSEDRLLSLVDQAAAAQVGPQELIDRIIADIDLFAGNSDQADDITLLALALGHKPVRAEND